MDLPPTNNHTTVEHILPGLQSDHKLRSHFMQAPAAIALLEGPEHVYAFANPRYLKLFSRSEDQLLGKTVRETFPEVEGQGVYELFDQVFLTGEPFEASEFEATFFDDGETKTGYYNFVIQPIKDDAGNITDLMVHAYEVTKQIAANRKMEEQEKQLHLITDALPVLISYIDKQGHYRFNNKAYETWFGHSREDIYGKHMKEVLGEKAYQNLKPNIKQALLGKPVHFENLIAYKNGGDRYVTGDYIPHFDNNNVVAGFYVVVNDITERKQSEKNLQESESRFRNLIEEATVATAVLEGPEWLLTLANEQMLHIWQRDRSIIGKKLLDFMPELTGQPFPDLLKAVYESGITYSDQDALVKLKRGGKLEDMYMDFSYKALRNSAGEVYAILVSAADVTERFKAKSKLQESENRFRNLVQQAPVAMLVLRGENPVFEVVNEAMLSLLGRDASIIGTTVEQSLPEVTTQPVWETVKDVYRTGEPYFAEELPVQFVKNDVLEEGYYTFSYIPLKQEGKVTGIMQVAIDMTQQVKARKKIEESETYFRQLTDTVPTIIWITDPTGNCTYLNKNWYDYTGQTKEDAEGFGWLNITHPDDKEQSGRIFLEANAARKPFSLLYRLRHKTGEYRWAKDSGSPKYSADGVFQGYIGTVVDVHMEKTANEKVRKSQQNLQLANEQLELVFRNIPAAVYLLNNKGELVYINDKGAQAYGDYTAEELLKVEHLHALEQKTEELFDRYHDDGRPMLKEQTPASVAFVRKTPEQNVIKLVSRENEEQFWYYVQAAPLLQPDGELSRLLISATDITAQKKAEEAIRQSEFRYRRIFETTPVSIWEEDFSVVKNRVQQLQQQGITDLRSYYAKHTEELQRLIQSVVVSDVNDITLQVLEAATKDELKRGLQQIFIEDTTNAFIGELETIANGGGHFEYESAVQTLKGRRVEVLVYIDFPLSADYSKVLVTLVDISDRKKAEQKIRESEERFRNLAQSLEQIVAERTKELQRSNEDLQQFAHVASHDLKEPVRKIKTFTGRLEQESDGQLDEKGKLYLSKVQGAADRMYSMIDGVLTYSTLSASHQAAQEIDLSEVLKSIETDLEVSLQNTDAVIQYSILPHLEGAHVLIYQLFYNLITNSIKFAKTGVPPAIAIQSKTSMKDGAEVAEIIVRDNGIGFDNEQAQKIFDTFIRLNSKDKYEGTGLGLALCKKIVERHGGTITASGKMNEGATFTIMLPLKQKGVNI